MRYLFRKGRMIPAADEAPKRIRSGTYRPGTELIFSKKGNIPVIVIKEAKG